MSVIKQPSEIQEKKNLVMMVYGSPGAGKTTLALSAPAPVLIDTDNGVTRTFTAHRCPTVQVTKWADVQDALNEIDGSAFKTIVVDTVGKLLDYMSDAIIAGNSKYRRPDGQLSLQGFGVRKQWFKDFVGRCLRMGKNVVFIAHAEEKKVGEDIVVRPIIGGSSTNDVMTELDMMGLQTVIGGKRVVLWGDDGSSFAKSFFSKNTCFLPNVMEVPACIDPSGHVIAENDFLTRVFAQYQAVQAKKEEYNKRFADLVRQIKEDCTDAESAEELNALLKKYLSAKFEHMFNSKLIFARELDAKAKKLGVTFDKEKKKYVSAE